MTLVACGRMLGRILKRSKTHNNNHIISNNILSYYILYSTDFTLLFYCDHVMFLVYTQCIIVNFLFHIERLLCFNKKEP